MQLETHSMQPSHGSTPDLVVVPENKGMGLEVGEPNHPHRLNRRNGCQEPPSEEDLCRNNKQTSERGEVFHDHY